MKHPAQSTRSPGSGECSRTTRFFKMLLPTFFKFNVNKWSPAIFVVDNNLNSTRTLTTTLNLLLRRNSNRHIILLNWALCVFEKHSLPICELEKKPLNFNRIADASFSPHIGQN